MFATGLTKTTGVNARFHGKSIVQHQEDVCCSMDETDRCYSPSKEIGGERQRHVDVSHENALVIDEKRYKKTLVIQESELLSRMLGPSRATTFSVSLIPTSTGISRRRWLSTGLILTRIGDSSLGGKVRQPR